MRNDIIFKRSVQFRDQNKNSWTVDFEVYKEESTRINRETLQKFKQSFSVSVCGAGGMSAGQCYDHINPRTEGQKKLLEFWNKYHLGGMSGGTVRQDEYLNGGPMDVVVHKVWLNNNSIKLSVYDNGWGNKINIELDDISPGHLSYIIEYMPVTDKVKSVAINDD